MRKRVSLCLALIVIIGCAGGKLKPQGRPEYPPEQFLTATGIGQSEQEARSQAVAELSRIFQSKVTSDTLDRVKAVVPEKGKETYEQRVDSSVRVLSDVELKGVQVPKTWVDEKRRVYYALAVLDRSQARDTWLREIRNSDGGIEGELKIMESLESKFRKLKSLQRILALWLEREVLVSRLRVLGFQEGASPSYDMKAVFKGIVEMKKDMTIAVIMGGEYGEVVKKALLEQMSSAGYVMSSDVRRADVLVSGSVKTEPVDLDDPDWEFARASVSLTITDEVSSLTVGELSESVRAGQLNYTEAVQKALRKASSDIAGKLVASFEE